MKTEELEKVMNAFFKLKKPWAMTGNLGNRMHAYYAGYKKFPKPNQYNFIVSNKNAFSKLLMNNMGYGVNTMTSRRNKFTGFKKNSQYPIILHFSNTAPNIVFYKKYPVQVKSKLATRRSIQRTVFNNLNASLN